MSSELCWLEDRRIVLKRLSLGIVSLCLIGIFLAACADRSASVGNPNTTPTTKIRIGTDGVFPPYEFFDMSKKVWAGFDVDLMKAIAARSGLEVEFVNAKLNRILGFVASCQLDGGISAIIITDELKQQMNFSDPYITVGQVVVVKKGNITITGRDQLSGMTVGSWQGSPSTTEIMQIPGTQLKMYDSFDFAFQDLIAGYIDAVIADLPRALSYVNIKANNLKIVGDEFASVRYGIAICKNQVDLVKKINDSLTAVKADGTLDKLAKKWKTQVSP